jgi:CRP/FNR family cyclic AMP-dependent transcriptional regulator
MEQRVRPGYHSSEGKLNPMPVPPEILREVGLFDGLSDRDIQRLAEAWRARVFSAGDVILTEGEYGVGFYVIGEGTVTYSVNGEDVGSAGPGDYFGEIALVSDSPRSATVTAATDVTVYAMTLWDFRALVEEKADVASRLLQAMAERKSTES